MWLAFARLCAVLIAALALSIGLPANERLDPRVALGAILIAAVPGAVALLRRPPG